MEIILPAHEYLQCSETYEEDYDTISLSDCKDRMIEFAQLHVKAALKEALDNVPYGSSTDKVSYEDVVGILTCYPLENIK